MNPKLQQAHFENLDPTPSAHVGSSTSNKMKRKKKSLLHPNKSTHLARKLINLLQVFRPIPFVPKHALNLSTHEKLLKRAGLWDFLHIKFDPALRSDLIAELIVSYNPQAPSYRRSFVNGLPINLTRSAMGRALGLPSRRKAGESCGGFEVVSDEELLFLEKVVLKWVVLGGVNDDVLDVLRFVKEGRPEWVDWASLVWVMVERELVKGVELVECYYASHLQFFLRKQRPNLFVEEVGKLGFDDLGVQELGLGILGVDERENEKKGKSLVGYQRRTNKSGKMVDREGQTLSGSSFGHGENEIEERLEVVNFGEKGGGDVVGGERSGVNDDRGEEVVDERLTGLENDEDRLSLMQDGNVNELEGECVMKEGEDTGGETGSEKIGLINEEGRVDDCKQDASFIYATEIEKEKRGLLVQHGEGDNEADVKMSGADDDSGKQLENECLDWIAEQGKDNQLKLDISVKEDEGMIGVNFSDSGDSCAMEQESETVGYCSLQGELELKAKLLEYEQIDMIQGKSDNGDREIGLDLGLKESDELMLAASVKELEDGSIEFCLLQSEMKMEGLLKEGEDVKMSSADDDDGKEFEIRRANLISEHGNSVMENQEKGLGVRQGEKDEVLEQADSAKQVGAVIDVEVSSSGNSSGNQFESNQMHSCARQSICRSDFVEVVREDDTVDFEDSKEKDKKQLLFQQCSLSMDAGFDSQSEKAVEVIEEVNVDFEEREEKDREWLFQHCSLSTDAGSQSQKAVEVGEDDYSDSARNLHCSPRSKVNDSLFVEPSVTGTRMKMEIASSDFFGNALKRKKAHANDVFIEPFVLEQNINVDISNISGASVFENSLKTEIDLLNDGHKRLKTEESDEEPMTNIDMSGVSMFPLKRKMDHTSDGHGRMISDGQSNEDLMDFNSWEEKIDFWLAEAKMVYAAREEAWLSAQLKEQKLVKKLEELDNTIHFYDKTKHEEIQKRNSKINCLENELFFMANQIDHYKKALQATHKTFAAYKERCGLPEEPLYMDIPGSSGIVLSTTEWEKERLRREHEDRTNCLLIDMMIKDFQLQWSDKLKGHAKKIMSLDNRLSDVEKEAKDLRTFSRTGFRESEK